MRPTWKRFATLLLCVAVGACAELPRPASQAIAELAPTGTLRVGFHQSDQFLVAHDMASAQYVGVAADLARSLSMKLGRPLQPVSYANVASLTASIGTNEWDIAFLAVDPALRLKIDFSRPYMEVDFSYLVNAKDQRFRTSADVDRDNVRIAVPQGGNAYRLVAASIKHAQVVPVRGGKIALAETLASGAADVYAESAQMLEGIAAATPDHRVLQDRFATLDYVVLVPKNKPEALNYVNAFLDAAAASGEIDADIKRARLTRVTVPRQPSK